MAAFHDSGNHVSQVLARHNFLDAMIQSSFVVESIAVAMIVVASYDDAHYKMHYFAPFPLVTCVAVVLHLGIVDSDDSRDTTMLTYTACLYHVCLNIPEVRHTVISRPFYYILFLHNILFSQK